MKHLFLFGALLVFNSTVYGQTADEYVRIGSWNIENLGDRSYGQEPGALAEHLYLADVDVLALQEIHDTDMSPDRRTNETLSATFEILNSHEGNSWKYVLFAGRDFQETARLTGVAWNTEVVDTVGTPLRIPVTYTGDEVWKRHPHAVKFSTGEDRSDFVVISTHMKSNRPVEGQPDPPVIRKNEAEALADHLDLIKDHFVDSDLIIAGDMNTLSGDEEALQVYRESGFLDLNSRDRQTYRKGQYDGPLDRILVTEGQDESRFSSQYVLAPGDHIQHQQRLSDHFLVLASMRVLPDDD